MMSLNLRGPGVRRSIREISGPGCGCAGNVRLVPNLGTDKKEEM